MEEKHMDFIHKVYRKVGQLQRIDGSDVLYLEIAGKNDILDDVDWEKHKVQAIQT